MYHTPSGCSENETTDILIYLQARNVSRMLLVDAVETIRRVTRLHRELDEVGFLCAAGDGDLAVDEERAQLARCVPRREVVAGIVARDEHRAFRADAAAAATQHNGSARRRRRVLGDDGEAACTVGLTAC